MDMKKYFQELDLSVLKELTPYLLMTALATCLLLLGILKMTGKLNNNGSVSVVVFDVVKFANAQRALASTFIGKREEAGEAGTLLLSLSKKTTATIERIAGPGTLVLVKQGLVSGAQRDITNDVLTELGLPTDVPTVDPVRYMEEVAPTMLMLPRRDKSPDTPLPTAAAKVLP